MVDIKTRIIIGAAQVMAVAIGQILSSSMEPSNAILNPICDTRLLWNVGEMVMRLYRRSEKTLTLLDEYESRLDRIEIFVNEHMLNGKPTEDHGERTQQHTDTSAPPVDYAHLPDQLLSPAAIALSQSYNVSKLFNSYPSSCDEAFQRLGNKFINKKRDSVYLLYIPNSGKKPFYAFCREDDKYKGRAYVLMQRRLDGSVNFLRDWHDYKTGFGNVIGEYWIGLDNLHWITTNHQSELWVKLGDWKGQVRNAFYETFGIDDETTFYTLAALGKYHGDAGDSLRKAQGCRFTTKDADYDGWPDGNCAQEFTGAWWYKHCQDANLNGQYVKAGGDYYYSKVYKIAQGVDWASWYGHSYSMKYVHMALRPMRRNFTAKHENKNSNSYLH